MSGDERADAVILADKLLDVPYADPDDDLRVLSRQLLRRHEDIARLTLERDALRQALNDCATRFEKASIHSGSDPEYAAEAAAKYRALAAPEAPHQPTITSDGRMHWRKP